MSTARIATIHFAPVSAERSRYRGYYSLPACRLNAEPFIYEVPDMMEHNKGPYNFGAQQPDIFETIQGMDIAQDIVNQWTVGGIGMTPDCRPGIWVVRERLPLMEKDHNGKFVAVLNAHKQQIFRPSTPEETRAMWEEDVAQNRRADRAYAEWCYREGNAIAGDLRRIQFIPEVYKLAARQYGMKAEHWTPEGAALESMACESCTRIVAKATIYCPHCHQPANRLRAAQFTVEAEQMVQAEQTRVREAKKLAKEAEKLAAAARGEQPEQTYSVAG
jgi:RNA polymerase subunit RPABC4/transcription elongation factor Spt4